MEKGRAIAWGVATWLIVGVILTLSGVAGTAPALIGVACGVGVYWWLTTR